MGSPFASLSTSDPIPLPFDPGQSIVVRKLTGREFEQAQESHARGVAVGRSRLWSETFKRILEKGVVATAELQAELRDPLTGFDRYAVIRSGLVSWTYPQSLKPVVVTPAVPASDGVAAVPAVIYDAIDDSDDEAIEFIARAILQLTKPALFLTVAEQEQERKNG